MGEGAEQPDGLPATEVADLCSQFLHFYQVAVVTNATMR
jgi:hypothetical protein